MSTRVKKRSWSTLGWVGGGCWEEDVAPCLHRLSGSEDKVVQHVDVGVLAEDVGFSVMLEMTMIPPVGRSSLDKHSFNGRALQHRGRGRF